MKLWDEEFAPTPRFTKNDYVRYVLVGSRRGVYGGPFDTTLEQHRLLPALMDYVVAGCFQNDKPKLELPTVFFHPVRHVFGRKDFLDVSSLEQIKALWRVAGAGIVHISFSRGIGAMTLLLFCKFRRAKVILQTHGMLTSRRSVFHDLMDSVITRRILGRKSLIVALTSVESEELLNWYPKLAGRIRVVGNPVQLGSASVSDIQADKSAMFIARLHPRKKVLDFGAAAKIAHAKMWTEQYQVLGPDEGDLDALLMETRGLSNFKYLGSTDQAGVIDRLRSCGVFVLTSRDEPWGNVLVAAICLGKPVVATASSALAGVVKKYEAGLVVEDGDTNAIAVAVHNLLEKDIYPIYSRNAFRCAAKEFNNSRVKAKWQEIYQECSGLSVASLLEDT